jgi:hypothetical protein
MLTASGAAMNTAANYRYGFIGALVAANPGGPMAWRPGIIPSAGGTTPPNIDLAVTQTATASNQVLVAPGTLVIPKAGLAAGPYLVGFPTVSTLTTDPASSTNPRIDVVAAQVIDNAIGDSGTQGGQLFIVNGTPGATPAIPAPPPGAIQVAQLYRATNVNTVTAANITDARTSAGVAGGVRALLPGDPWNGAGAYIGECTFDAVTSFKSGLRYWDGTQWRGVATKIVPYTLNIALSAAIDSAHSPYTCCTATVADPGYPYYLAVSAKAGGSNASSGTSMLTRINLDGNTISIAWSTLGAVSIWESNNPTVIVGPYTGSHTLTHTLAVDTGGPAATSNNAADIYLSTQLIPY